MRATAIASRRRLVVPILTVMLAATACQGGEAASDGEGEFPDVWKYGTIQAMTGFGSHWGDQQAKAHRLCVEQLNDSGEFPFEIEVIVGDHKSDDPTAAVSAAQRMVNVDGIEWFNSSWVASTQATNPILSGAQVPAINAVGTGEGLTGLPWLYNLRLQSNQTAPYVVEFVKNNYDIERAAFAWWSDAHAVMGEQSVQMAEQLGVEVTLGEAFEPGTSDFRSLLAKIEETNPDAIFLSAFGADVGHFVQQAREMGIFPDTIIAGNIVEPDSYEVAGEALDGFIYAESVWRPDLDTELNSQFMESFTERWGFEESEVLSAAAMEYEACWSVMRNVLRNVLDNGGDPFDGQQLQEAILGVDGYQTIYSDDTMMQIREDGTAVKPLHFIETGPTFEEYEILGQIDDPVPFE
jgi:ABC-type branched-subunit amino acid transport system substrate-binding protein